MKLILASASERRRELMERLDMDFQVVVSDFDEAKVEFNNSVLEYVQQVARGKALCALEKLSSAEHSIIIGCDTVVVINGRILGKPKDREEAFSMLKELSGERHQVYSGIALFDTESHRLISDFQCTKVKFSKLEDETINWYISTGEPFDKAGAYGLQGYAGAFVEEIQGCYYNVVGLPLNKLSFMLRDMGVNLYKGDY